jgi:ATP-dependent DNA helicase DinG
VAERESAREALSQAVRAAAALPGEGWSGRIAPPGGEVSPIGPIEAFLVAVLEQLRARAEGSELGMECQARPALELVRETAAEAARALAAIEAPLLALTRYLADALDEDSDTLVAGDRARIEGALRGLDRRARMMLPAWRSMLRALGRTPRTIPTSSTGSTRPSCTAAWSMRPAAGTGSTRPSRWPRRCWRRRTACW